MHCLAQCFLFLMLHISVSYFDAEQDFLVEGKQSGD